MISSAHQLFGSPSHVSSENRQFENEEIFNYFQGKNNHLSDVRFMIYDFVQYIIYLENEICEYFPQMVEQNMNVLILNFTEEFLRLFPKPLKEDEQFHVQLLFELRVLRPIISKYLNQKAKENFERISTLILESLSKLRQISKIAEVLTEEETRNLEMQSMLFEARFKNMYHWE